MNRNATIRVLTTIVGLPVLIAFGALGGWPLKVCLLAIALTGMWEFYRPLSGGFKFVHIIGYLFAALYILFVEHFAGRLMFIPVAGLMLFCLAALALCHPRVSVRDVVTVVFGFFYVAFLLSCVYLIRETMPRGDFAVWLVFIAAWGCDTGAYVVGKLMGRHKLAPNLSPKKTWEGSIGGVAAAAGLAALYVFCLTKFSGSWNPPAHMYLFTAIAAGAASVLGQLGDLSASAIKRYAKIKDFGNIIPGHGGVLDRFDSVLFTAPAVYILVLLLWRG